MLRICSLLVLTLMLSFPAAAQTVAGKARVADGDTLTVSGERIRLHGIDAPELRQTCKKQNGQVWRCGHWARNELQQMVRGQRVSCNGIERDRYDRLVAKCYAGDDDLGKIMVERGAAQAYRKYSLEYVDAEKQAFVAGSGIWQGEVVAPEQYRRQPEPAPVRADGCVIKGNISASGQIYHLPGQEHYGKTRISEAKGERWFCSEKEARAAGWRKARR